MLKYLFLFFFLFLIWGCDTPDGLPIVVPDCSIEKPCQDGYSCEEGKCVVDTIVTDCTAGETKACYTGGSATKDVGTCKEGIITCNDSGEWNYICSGEIKPTNEVCGDDLDNNCNGKTDEDCGCDSAGSTRSCYTGAQDTADKGICKSGVETCLDTKIWSGQCDGETLPVQGLCETVDNDCNGSIDSGESRCEIAVTDCTAGERKECHTNGNNVGIGVCKSGYNLCNSEGIWESDCLNEVIAEATDVCGDGIDNNCDGIIDNECACTPGEEKACYTGNPDELGKGICESGILTCNLSGEWNSDCQGEERPTAEACDNIDNDCDGIVDNGVANACGSCGATPIEICDNIDNDCDGIIDNVIPANGGNACGGCGDVPSEVCGNNFDDDCDGTIDNSEICDTTPECVKTSDTDICDNGLDDDCDGSVDNGECGRCGELPPVECFSGSPSSIIANGTNASICKKGTSICIAGESWGECKNEILPKTETCNSVDDDCDGIIDNGFNVGQACSVGVGECKNTGTYSCNNQGGVTCIDANGSPIVAGASSREICDGLDNNCNGVIDEIFSLNQNCYSGLGECQTVGKTVCSANKLDVVCDSTPSNGSIELCGDGLDNDCNGLIDDIANIGLPCEDGIGACKRTGSYSCDELNNVVNCSAIPGSPVSEICGDNIDNDCDGITDTDPELGLGGSCTLGVGICERTDGYICVQNNIVCGAIPGTSNGVGEVCGNGFDDDCDGEIDEDCLTVDCSQIATPALTARPVSNPDGFGRAFTNTEYSFTPIVDGEIGTPSYKWELIAAPDSNGQELTSLTSLTTKFTPYLISGREAPATPQPYILEFTATELGNSASCTVQFYAVSEDFIHVELTWGNASDMDLHMLVPSATSAAQSIWEVEGYENSYDCGYNNCDSATGLEWNSSNADDNPHLDIDNIPGFDCNEVNCDKPENINVPIPRNNIFDTYRIGVYAFTDNGLNLKIKVNCLDINGLDLIKEYSLNSLSHKNWWYMSDVKWKGSYCEIEDVNPNPAPNERVNSGSIWLQQQ